MTGEQGKPPQRGVRDRLRGLAGAPWLRPRRLVISAVVVAALVGFGVLLGYSAAKGGLVHDLRVSVLEPTLAGVRHAMGHRDESHWEAYESQLGNFQLLRVSVADRDGDVMAALEELDGHFLFLTQTGHFSELSPDHALRDLQIDLPMHTEEARAANIPNMDFNHFRALDLLAVSVGDHTYDLYASYDRFLSEERCFEIAVSRMRLAVSETAVMPQSPWEDVYATRPCVPPRTGVSQFASAIVGIQSGGRLVLRDPHTLLFSVGDLEFDGVMYPGLTEAPNGPQNPDWDLGKILEIDVRTGRARRLAMGFRNPQGLAIDALGRIWETEHGPYGGDEINLIRQDGNYGWPNVTYGMMYVPLRENWPLNTTRGGHEGYDRPAYVFVPSIGISQLVQPSAEEFPFWERTLLVTSLRGRALFAARLDGDRIVYAEPLPLGERLRDIISLSSGQIAILTDGGTVMFIRSVREGDDDTGYILTDLREGAGAAGAIERGRQVFAGNCQTCHSVTGQLAAGPPLNGVVGRDIASTDFAYSAALQRAEGAWTRGRLMELFMMEGSPFPGSTMPAPQLTRDQARDLIAYLRTTEAQ